VEISDPLKEELCLKEGVTRKKRRKGERRERRKKRRVEAGKRNGGVTGAML